MDKLQNFIGIDISKKWFDVALLKKQKSDEITHHQFEQTNEGLKAFNSWLKENGIRINNETIFCMENTGVYNDRLVNHLLKKKALVWVEMPLRIKRSEDFQRGKNDKIDSIKIALYAFRYQDRISLWSPMDDSLRRLRNLSALRNRIIKAISQLSVPVNELKSSGSKKEASELDKIQKDTLTSMEKAKKETEQLIEQTIKKDQHLNHVALKAQTVSSIGPVTTTALLIYTNGFKGFETGKQLACYCGVVPFERSSGSSLKSKPRVSPFANKELKKLIHMCAMNAIQNDHELKGYYERRVGEGKDKMKVINAVRNKLILRVFAVVRDDRDYDKNYERKCA